MKKRTFIASLAALLPVAVAALDAPKAKAELKAKWSQDAIWTGIPEQQVTLIAQPMVTPKPAKTLTASLRVQAQHNGEFLAVRLRWLDPEPSMSERPGRYPDAIAMQFPVNGQMSTPPFMGAKGMPVHIYHWKTHYQVDGNVGKRTMKQHYPNMQMDMYPMEYSHSELKEKQKDGEDIRFNPAIAVGNPMSEPKKTRVDELLAEGFGTSSPKPIDQAQAFGSWSKGEWTVTILRPFKAKDASQLEVGKDSYMCFAIWQGGAGEIGSRKSVAMSWLPVAIK